MEEASQLNCLEALQKQTAKAEGKEGEGEQAARTKGLWGGVLNSAASHSQRSSLVNSSGKPLPPAEQARDRCMTVTTPRASLCRRPSRHASSA